MMTQSLQNAGEEAATYISITFKEIQVHGAVKPLHQALI